MPQQTFQPVSGVHNEMNAICIPLSFFSSRVLLLCSLTVTFTGTHEYDRAIVPFQRDIWAYYDNTCPCYDPRLRLLLDGALQYLCQEQSKYNREPQRLYT